MMTYCCHTLLLSYSCIRNTSAVLQVTLISALAFSSSRPRGMNIYFAICIVLICASHLILASVTGSSLPTIRAVARHGL